MTKTKTILATLVLIASLANPQPAHAQAGFIWGVVAGAMLFGGDDGAAAGSGINVVYTMPRASERVQNPMGIRFVTYRDCGASVAIWEMFRYALKVNHLYEGTPNPETMQEVLQVVRVFLPSNAGCANFWFAYVDKQSVIPLEKLGQKPTPVERAK